MTSMLGMTCEEYSRRLNEHFGISAIEAVSRYRRFFKELLPNGSPDTEVRQIAEEAGADPRRILETADELHDGDLVKYAFRLAGGGVIESVVIPMPRRTTLCVSSQVGCRMGCTMCATGQMGFQRNLSAEEIVAQVCAARTFLGHAVDNVVFMGMGEPLDNLDNVVQAVRVLSDQRGSDIAHSRITVSTCGHVEGLQKLAKRGWARLGIAVSLNAADDELRSRLMPVSARYPLAALRKALREYPLGRGRIFFIEYILMQGINDSPGQADALARFLDGLPVRINIIPCNPVPGLPFIPSEKDAVQRFCSRLREKNLFVRMRTSRGGNILAACGQLGSAERSEMLPQCSD